MTGDFYFGRGLLAELGPGESLAVALSGGPDSFALCHYVANSSSEEIHALTVDHSLRPCSAAEATQIAAQIVNYPNVRHKILIVSRETIGDRVMAGAREARYAVMAEYCAAHGIKYLYTGHHLDDQAETVLFRLAKGSGLDGLAGMRREVKYNDNLTIVRPFLDVPKSELIAYCHAHNLPYIEDPTNQNLTYARNRLRQSAAVLAREGLTAKRLGVTARRLARAADALDFYAAQAFAQAVRKQTADSITLDYAALTVTPAETQLRVILLSMDKLTLEERPGHGPRRERLEILVRDLFGDAPFRKRTLGGFMFARDDRRNALHIEKEL